jgi:hypothetical protein
VAGDEMLQNDIARESRFPGTGLPDDMNMAARVQDAEAKRDFGGIAIPVSELNQVIAHGGGASRDSNAKAASGVRKGGGHAGVRQTPWGASRKGNRRLAAQSEPG